jgi:hypothetical protein
MYRRKEIAEQYHSVKHRRRRAASRRAGLAGGWNTADFVWQRRPQTIGGRRTAAGTPSTINLLRGENQMGQRADTSQAGPVLSRRGVPLATWRAGWQLTVPRPPAKAQPIACSWAIRRPSWGLTRAGMEIRNCRAGLDVFLNIAGRRCDWRGRAGLGALQILGGGRV